jgi:hypothetical protein
MSPAGRDRLWLDPFPDLIVVADGSKDPADVVAARSSMRLALVASLQHLPPRQRAVFILREGLGYPAIEVADPRPWPASNGFDRWLGVGTIWYRASSCGCISSA